jgi:hypothetical protein
MFTVVYYAKFAKAKKLRATVLGTYASKFEAYETKYAFDESRNYAVITEVLSVQEVAFLA